MAYQQRLHISELHFAKFTTPSTFSCWKIRFKTEVCTFSQFPAEEKWRWSIGWMIWNHRDQLRVLISRVSRCRTRELHLFWTRSSRIPTSRKRSVSRNRKLRKKMVLSRKTDRLHDPRLLSSYWRSRSRSWLRWSILYHSSQRWCSGTRYEMGWNSIVCDKDPTWRYPGKFV